MFLSHNLQFWKTVWRLNFYFRLSTLPVRSSKVAATIFRGNRVSFSMWLPRQRFSLSSFPPYRVGGHTVVESFSTFLVSVGIQFLMHRGGRKSERCLTISQSRIRRIVLILPYSCVDLPVCLTSLHHTAAARHARLPDNDAARDVAIGKCVCYRCSSSVSSF